MPSHLRLLLGGAVLSAALLAGCSNPAPTESSSIPSTPPGTMPDLPTDAAAYIDADGVFTPPLQKILPGISEDKSYERLAKNTDEINKAVVECMANQGFSAPTIPPPPTNPSTTTTTAAPGETPARTYGIALHYRDILLPKPGEKPPGTAPPGTAMPADQQKALTGEDGSGGCVAEARKAHPQVDPTPALNELTKDVQDLQQQIADDSRVKDAERRWAACMAPKHPDYAKFTFVSQAPALAQNNFQPLISDGKLMPEEYNAFEEAERTEKRIAADDYACSTESGYITTLQQVTVDKERQFIIDHWDKVGVAYAQLKAANGS